MRLGQKIIDMRCRPPYKGFLNKGYPFDLFDVDVAKSFQKQSGLPYLSKALVTKSMDDFIQEMDIAGVDMAVAPYRAAWGDPCNKRARTDNQDLVELMETYPGRFIGVAAVSPVYYTEKENLEIIDKFCVNGPLRGVAIEPIIDDPNFLLSDEKVFHIYEKCGELGLPVLCTFGQMPPQQLGALAIASKAFPKTNFVLCHGGQPYALDVCAMASAFGNIYISPDSLMVNSIFTRTYIDTANYALKDRLCFGSNFPGYPMDWTADYYMHCGLREEVLPNVMYNNAARLFGLLEDDTKMDDNGIAKLTKGYRKPV